MLQRKSFQTYLFLAIILLTTLLPLSCDIFTPDGSQNDGVIKQGYFYLLDRSSASLIMLDQKLRELKRWDIYRLTGDSSVQGITFDGSFLWIASAGGADVLNRVDASDDTLVLVRSLGAPPTKKGTIRGLAWDGASLWAVNSGSTTSAVPATIYKLNPLDGTILGQYATPTHDPRGLTYVSAYTDVYGRTATAGIVYTDIGTNKIYKLIPDLSAVDTVFSSPLPPRGTYYTYPSGITFDGQYYWIVNSSNTSDHLFVVSYKGHVETMFDLPYYEPGSIVYSTVDVRIPPAPVLTAITPNYGVSGRSLSVDILGSEFVNKPGLTVTMGEGITVDTLTYVSTTQLHVKITIDSNATVGYHDVTVINPGGKRATLVSKFQVALAPPVTHLWLIEQDLDSLYSIRISDTASILKKWDTRVIAAGGSPQGLAYDGTNLWLCAAGTDKKLYKLNTNDSVLSSLAVLPGPTSSGTLRGITWESGSLWVTVSAAGTSGRIYRVDPSTGAIQDSVNTPGMEPRAVVFANGSMFTNDTSIDSVFVFNGISRTWNSVFATPTPPGGTTSNRFATGMAWDGTNFWIANSSTTYDHVFQVSPLGVVLQYIASPRIGSAQITGIVVTP